MNCQYMDVRLPEARVEKEKILKGLDSHVLNDCVTCYACEAYCPSGNHPFYQIVDHQEEKGVLPVPNPLAKQQVRMMRTKGTITPAAVNAPVINMCYFPMLTGCVRSKLEDAVKVENLEGKLQVKEISEIVRERTAAG